jgi:hypothetical protein
MLYVVVPQEPMVTGIEREGHPRIGYALFHRIPPWGIPYVPLYIPVKIRSGNDRPPRSTPIGREKVRPDFYLLPASGIIPHAFSREY